MVFLGVALVGGLIAYLVWQQSRPASSGFEGAVRVEEGLDPDLPGEHVDIQGAYDGVYGVSGANTNGHVSRDVDYEAEQGLPPAGGPHWGSTGCGSDPETAPSFCGPAPWGIFIDPWDAETLVHNMEHGGVVVWYNTTDDAVVDDLTDFINDRLDDRQLIVMSPLPEMEEGFIAVTTWARRDIFPVEEYTRDRVDEFIKAHERRFNPENF